MKKVIFLILTILVITGGVMGVWAQRQRNNEGGENRREEPQIEINNEERERERIEERIREIETINEEIKSKIDATAKRAEIKFKEGIEGIVEEIKTEYDIEIVPEIVETIQTKGAEKLKEGIKDLGNKVEDIEEVKERRDGKRARQRDQEGQIGVLRRRREMLERAEPKAIRREIKALGIDEGLIDFEEIEAGIEEYKREIERGLERAQREKDEIAEELKDIEEEEELEREEEEIIRRKLKEKILEYEIMQEIKRELEKKLEGEQLDRVMRRVRVRMMRIRETVTLLIEEMEKEVRERIDARSIEIAEIERDSDGDGLSDKEEFGLGTDIFNPDSDDDYFLDGIELKHGFDPLNPAEEVEIVVQDPREVEPKKIDVYIVERAELITLPEGRRGIKISGRGLPNSNITLFIFSKPVTVSVRIDDRGRWSYVFEDPQDGKHEVYIAITNNKGDIEARSLSFPFILAGEDVVVLPHIAKIAAMPIEEIKMGYLLLTLVIAGAGLIAALIIIKMLTKRKRETRISL
jgi:hypothetical protein